MARNGRGGGNANSSSQNAASNGKYNEWPKGTKWAYFKRLPQIDGENHQKSGWVRVGSKLWHTVQSYNSAPLFQQHPEKQYHASRKATQTWNPESPRGKLILQGGGSGNGAHPGDGAQGGNDPGRGGEQGAHHRGSDTTTTAGTGSNPPKSPPKDHVGAFSKTIGNPITQLLQDPGAADAIAGLQFDAQIHDTKGQIADQKVQGDQDLADIGHWYDHILSLNNAAQADNQQAVDQAANADHAGLMQGLAAIGGSSNQDAGMALAQGSQGEALARMLGTIQSSFHDNMATALANNEAGQKSAQDALNSQAQQGLHQTLQDLQGQRGQAVTSALQTILAANNAARQTNFGNRISKLQSILGAQQLTQNLKISKAQLAQMGSGSGGDAGHTPWYKMTPQQKASTAVLLMQGGANGGPVPLQLALARATQSGYDAALVRPYLQTFYPTS